MDQFPAPIKAKAVYTGTVTVSSVVTLTDNTTTLEVGAIGGGGLAIRWIPATETAAVSPFGSVIASGVGANFDHFIPANNIRRFVVPIENIGAPTSIVGVNKQLGLYNRVAWVQAVAMSASVMGTEY